MSEISVDFHLHSNTLKRSVMKNGTCQFNLIYDEPVKNSLEYEVFGKKVFIINENLNLWNKFPFSYRPMFIDQFNFGKLIRLNKEIHQNCISDILNSNLPYKSCHINMTGMIALKDEKVWLLNDYWAGVKGSILINEGKVFEFISNGVFKIEDLNQIGIKL